MLSRQTTRLIEEMSRTLLGGEFDDIEAPSLKEALNTSSLTRADVERIIQATVDDANAQRDGYVYSYKASNWTRDYGKPFNRDYFDIYAKKGRRRVATFKYGFWDYINDCYGPAKPKGDRPDTYVRELGKSVDEQRDITVPTTQRTSQSGEKGWMDYPKDSKDQIKAYLSQEIIPLIRKGDVLGARNLILEDNLSFRPILIGYLYSNLGDKYFYKSDEIMEDEFNSVKLPEVTIPKNINYIRNRAFADSLIPAIKFEGDYTGISYGGNCFPQFGVAFFNADGNEITETFTTEDYF